MDLVHGGRSRRRAVRGPLVDVHVQALASPRLRVLRAHRRRAREPLQVARVRPVGDLHRAVHAPAIGGGALLQRRSVRSAPRDVPERAVREGQPEHAHRGSSVVPGLHRVAREDVERQQERRDADAQDEHEGPLRGGPTHARGGGASQLRLDALAHFPVARVGLGGLVARVLSLGHPTHGVRGGRPARASPVTRSATRFSRSFRLPQLLPRRAPRALDTSAGDGSTGHAERSRWKIDGIDGARRRPR